MRLRLCFLILGGLFFSAVAQEYAPGDQWSLFFWKRESGQTQNQGYYCGSTIENIYTQNNRTTIRGNARVDMPGWAQLVFGNKAESQIVINRSLPSTITAHSSNLESAEWLETLTATMGNQTYICNFLFPILGQGSTYSQGDHFTVAKDGVELLFTAVNENLFVGKFSGSTQNAFYILTSSQHPLRIHSVEISGDSRAQAETYLGIDLGQFDNDAEAYGFDFIDTTVVFYDTTVTQTSLADTTVSHTLTSDTLKAQSTASDTIVSQLFLTDTLISVNEGDSQNVSHAAVVNFTVTGTTTIDTIVHTMTILDTTFTDSIFTITTIRDTIITGSHAENTTRSDTTVIETTARDTSFISHFYSDTAIFDTTVFDTTASDTTILDTTVSDTGSFNGLAVEGSHPLHADSSYRVLWDVSDDDSTASCSLLVNYADHQDWRPLAMVNGPQGSIQWHIPAHQKDTAVLRLRTFDDIGAIRKDIDVRIPILPGDTVVQDTADQTPTLTIDGSLPVQTDSSYSLYWDASKMGDAFSVCTLFVSYGDDTRRHILLTTSSATGGLHWYVPSHSDSATLTLQVFDSTHTLKKEIGITVPIQRVNTGTKSPTVVPAHMALSDLSYTKGAFSIQLAAPLAGLYDVRTAVYTPQGRLLFRNEGQSRLSAGHHVLSFKKDVSNGTYLVRVEVNHGGGEKRSSRSRVMTIVK